MNNKFMTDLQRILKAKDFQSDKELNDFLSQYNGQIPSFPEEALSQSEKAEDLVFKATELSKTRGIKLANEALALDPDCIMAYEYLSSVENKLTKSNEYLIKGIEIGKKLYGGSFEKENVGYFWMIHETRPYMSCLFHLSMNYFEQEKIDDAVSLLEKLLYLNPNDNQGVRHHLSSFLLKTKAYKKFNALIAQFENESNVFFLYNQALLEFIKNGPTVKAQKLLNQAIEYNPHVLPIVIKEPRKMYCYDSYSLGSKEEAHYYVSYSMDNWSLAKGSISWIKKHVNA